MSATRVGNRFAVHGTDVFTIDNFLIARKGSYIDWPSYGQQTGIEMAGRPGVRILSPQDGPETTGGYDPETHGCYSPSWSPDGRRIVFARSDADGVDESICVANADGSDLVQLTEGEDDHPAWGSAPR